VTHVSSNVPAQLYLDKRRLMQIIGNLTSNAAKFTDSGFVRISMEHIDPIEETSADGNGGASLKISVQDSGRGISKDDQARLFRPFEHIGELQCVSGDGVAASACSSLFRSSGLGLYIVESIANMIGGKMTLVSELGVGSTFSLSLPLLVKPEQQ
jgi:signal transduction histidine kinase